MTSIILDQRWTTELVSFEMLDAWAIKLADTRIFYIDVDKF